MRREEIRIVWIIRKIWISIIVRKIRISAGKRSKEKEGKYNARFHTNKLSKISIYIAPLISYDLST